MRIAITRMTWAVTVLAVLANLPALAASSAFGNLADMVLHKGVDAQLPPHLSLVLGIGTGDAIAVKQAVLREGAEVRTFNVSAANPGDIVLVRTNERDRTTTAFLVSKGAKLRKAIAFRYGEPPHLTPTAQATAAFAAEMQYWSDHLTGP